MAIPPSVTSYLHSHHAPYVVLEHPVAYTAQEEAALSRVPGHAWAKAVVCIADGKPLLAVLPAPMVVDFNRLRLFLGVRDIRLARESEIRDMYDGCEVGAMPPFGELYGQRVVVDTRLVADADIFFNGGSHRDAIRMRYHDFDALVHPQVALFAALNLFH